MSYHIPNFKSARVLVVGDVMLDRYWSGPTHRISPEAPVPVVEIKKQEECPGGAANVALNVAVTGASVYLLGICGDDAAGDMLEKKLREGGVETHLLRDPKKDTIIKLRILNSQQQVVRLDFEDTSFHVKTNKLTEKFQQLLDHVDVVILSDYAKGTLADAATLIALANAKGIRVLVDPKTDDLLFYQGAFLITPNLKEFEAIVGKCPDEKTLFEKGNALVASIHLSALLVTRSEKGMTLFQNDKVPLTLAAQQQEVYDVTGAGDTVIAYLGASLAAGVSLEEAVQLANLAAGISVRKLNAATVSIPELRREIWHLKSSYDEKHIVSEEELLTLIADAKTHGEVIVMTNGCFDILHLGHITYLEQAKQLGDRLIVAVNDDDSVRALKGESRPINPLAVRMQMLAALRAVDFVVPFSGETPEALINAVLPHILVKGGDYKVAEIAGHKAVLAQGGKVILLDFVPGFSTTSLIDRFGKK